MTEKRKKTRKRWKKKKKKRRELVGGVILSLVIWQCLLVFPFRRTFLSQCDCALLLVVRRWSCRGSLVKRKRKTKESRKVRVRV